jgi:ketosteroid isomerase-like protein
VAVEHPNQDYGRGSGAEESIEIVRRIYEAFARRDIEAALEYAAPDIELMPNGTASILGRAEPYRGHEGVREYFADAGRVWQDIRISADDFRSTAGGVVVFGRVDGVTGGSPVTRRAIWIWRVRDGLARSMRVSDT